MLFQQGFLHPRPVPMYFRIHCELDYALQGPATFLFALRCLQTGGQSVLSESLVFSPFVDVEEFSLTGGMNRFSRIQTWNPGLIKICYQAQVTTSFRIVPASSLHTTGLGNLNPDAIPFLFPSRYCQSDRLRQFALELFGHWNSSHAIATGVSDWIFENIAYVGGSSGENCSAIDTLSRRQGVCRDFAHLGIALCRALSVPARYATCYAFQLYPADFHACFEVFIDGWWYLFDPTRLAPLNGLVRIATGRDAADAAVCTTFGNPESIGSAARCECSSLDFQPITHGILSHENQAFALL